MDVVLHLLTVAPQMVCSKDASQPALFPTGAAASLYAGQVLTMSGEPLTLKCSSIPANSP